MSGSSKYGGSSTSSSSSSASSSSFSVSNVSSSGVQCSGKAGKGSFGKAGNGASFCGKSGKGKGNPPSFDPVCEEPGPSPVEPPAMCTGCGSLVNGINVVSQFSVPAGTMFNGQELGGISGITFDPDRGVYYLLSDANETGQQRFFTALVDPLTGAVTVLGVNNFRRSRGSIAGGDLKPEGIAYSSPGTLLVSSTDPVGVFEFDIQGTLLRYLNVPDVYTTNSDDSFGARADLGLGALSLSPNGMDLYAATEQALWQDGPNSSREISPSRVVAFDSETGQPGEEYAYYTDAGYGLTEIASLDDCGQVFLGLESSGDNCRLYEFNTCFATDVGGQDTIKGNTQESISEPFPTSEAVQKTLLADFRALGINVGNCEAMSFLKTGNGAATVLVASDNEFSGQSTDMAFLSITGNFP